MENIWELCVRSGGTVSRCQPKTDPPPPPLAASVVQCEMIR